jgi:osmotically-inducible protein OsmY
MAEFENRIQQNVENRLKWDPRLSAGEVEVEVKGSSVKLEGSVPNNTAMRAAEQDAYMVEGVRTVDNYLAIKFPEDSVIPDDITIESNIRNMFLWDNRINSTGISITVSNGVVGLDGTVNTYWEKTLAEDIASSATGVYMVNNNLAINETGDINDEILANQVRDGIDLNPYVQAQEIQVSVNEGIVTLSGNVQSYLESTEAHDAALHTRGVRGIVNNITVG